MAYFHCLIGGGSSGGGYELTVTCDADFAGTTITCTDGVTTLTQTCPSASPYEVVFEIPNGGDWTISGVVGGHTVSTGVNIPTNAVLIATIQQTVTIHSAKEDTISYTDIDGATQTITFASGETSKQVSITIEPDGNSFTFTSSVAKDPNNLSNDYSKTVTVDENTTDVYVMPDNALYWWGNMANSGGFTDRGGSASSKTLNINTIDIELSVTSGTCAVGTNQTIDTNGLTKLRGIVKATNKGITFVSSPNLGNAPQNNSYGRTNALTQNNTVELLEASLTDTGNVYTYLFQSLATNQTSKSNTYALWYE